MADEIKMEFTNPETAANIEYLGSWTVNDKPKRIAWPGTYDGLLCDITPKAAQKFVDSGHEHWRKKVVGSNEAVANSKKKTEAV
jgi:hypothetical protein